MKTTIYSARYTPELFFSTILELAEVLRGNPQFSPIEWSSVELARLQADSETISTVDFHSVRTEFDWSSPDGIPPDRIFQFVISGENYFDVNYWNPTEIFIADIKNLTSESDVIELLFSKEVFISGGDGDDIIQGYSKEDGLTGGSGSDILRGGDGDDRLEGGNWDGDLVPDGSDYLFGDSGDDSMYGGAGDDHLSGGLGHDYLYGQSGKDYFTFDTKLRQSLDLIWDFKPGTDMFELSSSIFVGLEVGELDDQAFKKVSHLSAIDRRMDRDDRIIFARSDHLVLYDRDGSGDEFRPVKFAWLTKVIDVDDFIIV